MNRTFRQRNWIVWLFCVAGSFIITACPSEQPKQTVVTVTPTPTVAPVTPIPTMTVTVTPTPTPTVTPIQNPPDREQRKQNVDIRKCSKPSPADYILSGDYDVSWRVGGGKYKGVLRMSEDSGRMVIESPTTEGVIIQDMRLKNCTFGLVVAGYNPRRPKDDSRSLAYQADNLVINIESNKIEVFNIDDQGIWSPVDLSPRK